MKTLDEFTALFADLFFNTDPSNIKADTVFHEIEEWSSLIALTVIAMVYDEFRVTIKGDDLYNAVTVEDIYKLVLSRM